jgi:hypothetical protein
MKNPISRLYENQFNRLKLLNSRLNGLSAKHVRNEAQGVNNISILASLVRVLCAKTQNVTVLPQLPTLSVPVDAITMACLAATVLEVLRFGVNHFRRRELSG